MTTDELDPTNLSATIPIHIDVDGVMEDKREIVIHFTNGRSPANRLLLRELTLAAYIRGFFAGVKHALKEVDKENGGGTNKP